VRVAFTLPVPGAEGRVVNVLPVDDERTSGLQTGADDYIVRPFDLDELLTARGGVVLRERLLNAVWGETADPLTNVVDVYVARLRRKPGEAGRSIETVRGSGYRLRPAAAAPEIAPS
jgi:DNA-binding response OmpR family regulator